METFQPTDEEKFRMELAAQFLGNIVVRLGKCPNVAMREWSSIGLDWADALCKETEARRCR